jgi:hypothetical protein
MSSAYLRHWSHFHYKSVRRHRIFIALHMYCWFETDISQFSQTVKMNTKRSLWKHTFRGERGPHVDCVCRVVCSFGLAPKKASQRKPSSDPFSNRFSFLVCRNEFPIDNKLSFCRSSAPVQRAIFETSILSPNFPPRNVFSFSCCPTPALAFFD